MAELSTLLAFGMAFLSLIGGVFIIIAGMRQHTRKLEMQHRERMAMIERGLAPGPAADPEAFEHAAGVVRRDRPASSRATSIGVVIVALGFGLMMLIGLAADAPGPGVGVGGAVVAIGAAFIVNGELKRRTQTYVTYRDDVMGQPRPGPYDPHDPA